MRETMLFGLGVAYLFISTCFFMIWLDFVKLDSSLSLQKKRLSLVTLAIASIFWLVVVPIAYLELLAAKRNNRILLDKWEDSEEDLNL